MKQRYKIQSPRAGALAFTVPSARVRVDFRAGRGRFVRGPANRAGAIRAQLEP